MNIADIQHMHENGRLEVKLSTHGKIPTSLWQSYSSFANTNGGTIALGIEEDHKRNLRIVGVPNAHDLVSMFWNNVNDGNTVSSNILVDEDVRIEHIDNKDVIIIDVPRASRSFRPVYTGKNPLTGTWRRKGEGDYRCSNDEIRSMLRDQDDESIDKTVVEEIGLEAIDHDTLNAYKNMFRARHPDHPWLKLPDDELLWKLGAAQRLSGDRNLHPTRAGLLMFGDERYITDEFSKYLLDFRMVSDPAQQRWDDRVMSADGTWSGNVFGFWLRVITKLTDGLPVPFNLSDGLIRNDDTPLRRAVREALTNTLGHADYLGRTGVVIVRYGNERITFRNPGALRIEPSVIELGGVSDVRNETIMKMFNLLGIGERAGSGFDTMREGTRSAGLPDPELIEELDPDRTTLVLPITTSTSSNTHPDSFTSAIPLNTRELTILNLLTSNSSMKTVDIATALELSPQRTRAILNSMLKKGLITKHGGSRNISYTKNKL